jgi:hypothetical protein
MNFPTPNIIKQAGEVIEADFDQKFGTSDKEESLYQAFWICNQIFREQNSDEETSKRIFLFTTEDNPSPYDQKSRDQAKHHAEVKISLFHMF